MIIRGNEITIMDFSGIYREMSFGEKCGAAYVDLREIPGTNCYCDEEAASAICKVMEEYSVSRVHFIDSGNYHYVSRLWTDRIRQPFYLIVLDNHTDMQPPAFGGLLSCGGWIASVLETNEYLQKVILIGPDQDSFGQVEPHLRNKTFFISREQIDGIRSREREPAAFAEGIFSLICSATEHEPGFGRDGRNARSFQSLYLSVDKDILREEEFKAGWSQGGMSAKELAAFLSGFFNWIDEAHIPLAGIDICGEPDPNERSHMEKSPGSQQDLPAGNLNNIEKSDRIDQMLLDIILKQNNRTETGQHLRFQG